MNCQDFREKMFLYPEVDEEFFTHLRNCDECRREFEEFLEIEKKLKEKVNEEDEIVREWDRVYIKVINTLRYEKIKRQVYIFILLLLEVFIFSLVFIIGYRLVRFFIQNPSLFVLTLKSLFQIFSQFNFYLFVILLLVFIYQTTKLHGKYK
uniref:Zf-HC2 domain-containing protein n=1 Tax=Dictyoglomus thermophilum TaxID=14 RepID=A0A7C3PPP9_DICTH